MGVTERTQPAAPSAPPPAAVPDQRPSPRCLPPTFALQNGSAGNAEQPSDEAMEAEEDDGWTQVRRKKK